MILILCLKVENLYKIFYILYIDDNEKHNK